MELSRKCVEEPRKRTGLGRCRHFFWLGVAFDTAGATVLFTGVFAHLVFSDLLLYLGSIIIFLSLLWWVFWYTGNIELTGEEPSKAPFHVVSSTVRRSLRRTISHRLSLTVCSVTSILRGFRRRYGRRRFLQTAGSLDMTVRGHLGNRLEKEDRDKDSTKSVRESGDAQDLRREHLGPKPEPVGSPQGVRSPGPEAGSPRPEAEAEAEAEAALPGLVKGSSSADLGPPECVESPPAPAVLPVRSLHVVPAASARQPPAVPSSKDQPAVTLASAGQPAASLAASSQPALVVAAQSQPLVPVASQHHPLGPAPARSNLQALLEASQSYSLSSAAAQSHLEVPPASQSQLEDVSLDSETPPPGAPAAQAQTLSIPVSLIQVLSCESFRTQAVDPRLSPAFSDLQALVGTQQVPQSTVSLAQGVTTPSQSAAVQEFQKPVARSSETPPPARQGLSQEPPATASPTPGPQAQQSVSPEDTPVPASEKRSHPP